MLVGVTRARGTTHPQAVEANSWLVASVYEQLEATRSETFRYATLLLPDESSFLHIAISDDDHPPLPQSSRWIVCNAVATTSWSRATTRAATAVIASTQPNDACGLRFEVTFLLFLSSGRRY
jgi:hypothetical protein